MRTGTIKPCPFCGSSSIDLTEAYGRKTASVFVECLDCGATGMPFDIGHDAEAVEAWNTRAEIQTQHTHCCPCGAERTCENSETNLSDTFFKCSACGAYSYSFLRHKDGTMDSTRYCPNCGAKVVE